MSGERFQSISQRYAAFRPRYPDTIVGAVADRISVNAELSVLPVIDMGSGTGTFTRQLSERLPVGIAVVGVEPSTAMREQAMADNTRPNVSFRDGVAENIPVADGGASAVVAATAAHWFDRPHFYTECGRALASKGVLAIVEYVRDEDEPATQAVIEFLDRYGEPRAYVRPDYNRELRGLSEFHQFEHQRERTKLHLTLDEYVGLALSSSHARKAVNDLGEKEAAARLRQAGSAFADDTGTVPYGYIFEAFMVSHR
ncbi:Methylase involved in ubiquinone/menaquinone biosynthesis [Mesorhizobium sp. J18]|uniref:class I SAM-dependent methyltransferase n=1 Tax=Mesorhizobium sp. J18 TaxID=935263 RepID=UPI00119B96AB|nr:methyltransferase domain-containing protein [Mesorhizobium sp. J18]TWG94187.1 Methylase involved in ubiquinone/menaquinone biosynthesis [Mesorhizobium sp. J18]